MDTRPVEEHGTGWSSLWDSGESGLWDRGKTSPALVDIIEKERGLLSPFASDDRRKKVLVPVGLISRYSYGTSPARRGVC